MDTKNVKVSKIKMPKLKKPNWQKDVFWATIICVLIFIGIVGYQFIKSPSKEMLDEIKKENASSNISFDQKTVDLIKERQIPPESAQPTVGKNPFTPF